MFGMILVFISHLLTTIQMQKAEYDLCYVTGEEVRKTERHANKLRNSGDRAKLISANDTSGFTFRGRFSSSGEAVAIGYDVSQKSTQCIEMVNPTPRKNYRRSSFS